MSQGSPDCRRRAAALLTVIETRAEGLTEAGTLPRFRRVAAARRPDAVRHVKP